MTDSLLSSASASSSSPWHYLWSFVDAHDRSDTVVRRRSGDSPAGAGKLVELSAAGRGVGGGGVSSWLSACQLSVWDNIAGPKVQQLWIGVDVPSDELQVTVARHSLAGDVAPPLPNAVDATLQVFSKFDAVALSTVFSAKHRRGLCKHSLSLLLHTRHLPRLVAVQHVFVDRVALLVRQLAALLDAAASPARALALFGSLLDSAVVQLERLAVDALPAPSLADTFLSASASRSLDAAFVARAVTSMLQTHGCVVVAGSANVPRINMFIASLQLFAPPDDWARSAFAAAPPADHVERLARAFVDSAHAVPPPARSQYVPNLLVQGVVDVAHAADGAEGQPGSLTAGLSPAAVMSSLLPTTLVLLDARTVRQTARYADFLRQRAECDAAAIERAAAAAAADSAEGATASTAAATAAAAAGASAAAAAPPAEGLFRTVTEVAPCVHRMLEDALSLPHYLRAPYVTTSVRSLTRKAALLVKFVEAATRDGSSAVPDNVVTRLRTDLGAREASDFSVLLGIAERLRPGSYHALGGDPSRIEEQLRDLFESF